MIGLMKAELHKIYHTEGIFTAAGLSVEHSNTETKA